MGPSFHFESTPLSYSCKPLKMFTKGHAPLRKDGKLKVHHPGRFQEGNTLWRNAYTAVNSEDLAGTSTTATDSKPKEKDSVPADGSITEVTAEELPCRQLRPRSRVPSKESSPSPTKLKRKESHVLAGMRFLDAEKVMEMMNSANKEHREKSPSCKEPFFQTYHEQKRGICWIYTLQCQKCSLTCQPYKLFSEVPTAKPGPNPGAPNVALAAALQDCPIGNTKTQEILARLNCPPPSRTSMNRRSNAVGTEIIKLNEKDMAEKVELVKKVNRDRGDPENQVSITVDGRYNSQTMTSRNKPGLNASQALALAVETVTGHNYIISAVYQNKLCWRGAWLRSKNFDVKCPGGHEGCTSNRFRAAPVSEYEMGKDIGGQLELQGMLVKYATTDGDARTAKGIQAATEALHPLWSVTRLADHVHLGQTQFRTAMRAHFTEQMFYGETKEERTSQKKAFCIDLKNRCSMIVKNLMTKYKKNIESVCKDLPAVLEATVRCYHGDCHQCQQHSVVCDGSDTSNWWIRSTVLSVHNIRGLRMKKTDVILLIELLKMKLSKVAIKSMRRYDSTNKNEAVHRAISVSLPKNVNFSKNMRARLNSSVHTNNNLPGTSAKLKSEHLGVELADESQQHLDRMDKRFKYMREYVKKPAVVKRQLEQSAKRMEEHKVYKELHAKEPEYKKDQLEDIPALDVHSTYCKKKLPGDS